jgi:hypothetical protein
MIVVSGVLRSGTTWLAGVMGSISGLQVANEPHNIPAGYNTFPDWWHDANLEMSYLWHRYGDHNRAVTPEMHRDIVPLFEELPAAFPGVGMAKIMIMPYWREMLEAWPDCKIVYLRRRLRSWLSCVARREWSLEMCSNADWGGYEPWQSRGDELAGEHEDLAPLYRACCLHDIFLTTHLQTLEQEAPGRFILIDYEALTASYDVEWERLCAFCEIPVPRHAELLGLALPVKRQWETRFGAREVNVVVDDLEVTA